MWKTLRTMWISWNSPSGSEAAAAVYDADPLCCSRATAAAAAAGGGGGRSPYCAAVLRDRISGVTHEAFHRRQIQEFLPGSRWFERSDLAESLCVVVVLFVDGLYLAPANARQMPRDDPRHIRARLLSVCNL
jgi:hypothetical protein